MSVTRRDFLSLVGTSVAGAAVVAASAKLSVGSAAGAATASLNEWKVSEVGVLDHGALPFSLTNTRTGEHLRIDACLRGSRRAPVASSREFDLFLHNNGSGHTATQREHQQVARALAKRLDKARSKAADSMLTMDARLSRHPELYDTNDDPVTA